MDAFTLVAIMSAQAIMLPSGEHTEAAKAAARAYSKQSGLEATAQDWERREVPQAARAWIGRAAFITKTVTEQRITFTVRFP